MAKVKLEREKGVTPSACRTERINRQDHFGRWTAVVISPSHKGNVVEVRDLGSLFERCALLANRKEA